MTDRSPEGRPRDYSLRDLAYMVTFIAPVALAFVWVTARDGTSWGLHLRYCAGGMLAGLLGLAWARSGRGWWGKE